MPPRTGGGVGCSEPHSGRETSISGSFWCLTEPPDDGGVCGQALGLLVPVSSHTLRCFHFRPINPLVWAGALPPRGSERPHLEASFPLRCFQRLSLPNVANQQCTWRYNWHTRGSSVPVLSY